MMDHLLLTSSLFILVVLLPTTLCFIKEKQDSKAFDVKIWEWHNSTYGLELAVWRKLQTADQEGIMSSEHIMQNVERNDLSRAKRADNQVSQAGRGNMWHYLLRYLLPYQHQEHHRGSAQEENNSSSVWWKLLHLMQPSGPRISTEAQGEVRTIPWSNDEQQGVTWQWPTRQGKWTAWTWRSHNNYTQDSGDDSHPEGNIIEGGGLRYEDNSGNESGAFWTRDALGTVTWHTRVQERIEERGTASQRTDGNHSRYKRDVRNSFLKNFIRVARNKRETKEMRNATVEGDVVLGESTTTQDNTRTQARLMSSESKIMRLNELLDSKSEDKNSETRASRKRWLEFVRELLDTIRRSKRNQRLNPKDTQPEEIDF